jgi:rubrerythrin
MHGNEEHGSNRDKAKQAKKDKFWCKSCDMAMTGEGSKCPICGNRANRKRNKK